MLLIKAARFPQPPNIGTAEFYFLTIFPHFFLCQTKPVNYLNRSDRSARAWEDQDKLKPESQMLIFKANRY